MRARNAQVSAVRKISDHPCYQVITKFDPLGHPLEAVRDPLDPDGVSQNWNWHRVCWLNATDCGQYRRFLMRISQLHRARGEEHGFTLVEVMVASALIGIMFLAFMAGFSTSFQGVQLDRENSRATQILLEKTELLRLYDWDQITGSDPSIYIPTNFIASFYPDTNNGGFSYSGTVVIANVPIAENYSNDMRQVILTVTWTSGRTTRSRTMSTFVSKYGLQNYIY
jgi:prepilin-type N-terminal cleavage/methylation domain-containing protein